MAPVMNDTEMIECHEPALQMQRLISIMKRLRAPQGCPWDAEQTHKSLITNMIEEAYEAVDTIQRDDWKQMREELGDVLLQVVFHAEIAQENGRFDFNDVAAEVSEKLIRRHPHVFASSRADTTDAVLTQWDKIKRQEKGTESTPYLHGTGKGLPALLRAWKLQKKAAKAGFDWPDAQGALDKVKEETAECEEILPLPEEDPRITEELGDLLFSVVNLCRKKGIDPEVAMTGANKSSNGVSINGTPAGQRRPHTGPGGPGRDGSPLAAGEIRRITEFPAISLPGIAFLSAVPGFLCAALPALNPERDREHGSPVTTQCLRRRSKSTPSPRRPSAAEAGSGTGRTSVTTPSFIQVPSLSNTKPAFFRAVSYSTQTVEKSALEALPGRSLSHRTKLIVLTREAINWSIRPPLHSVSSRFTPPEKSRDACPVPVISALVVQVEAFVMEKLPSA